MTATVVAIFGIVYFGSRGYESEGPYWVKKMKEVCGEDVVASEAVHDQRVAAGLGISDARQRSQAAEATLDLIDSSSRS